MLPAVEEARDVRVLEAGEDLALLAEAPEDGLRVHAPAHDLHGDALLERPVGALAKVHGAHPAVADLLEDLPRADPRARRLGRRGRRFEEPTRVRVRREERRHLGLELRVARGADGDERAPFVRRLLPGRVEETLRFAPAFGSHSEPPSSR